MSNSILHSAILTGTLWVSFYFAKVPFAHQYIAMFAGVYILLFLIRKVLFIKSALSRIIESMLFTIIIMSLVNSTGGLTSPLFFLVYFLIFSLSLLLEPITAVVSTLSLITLFILSLPKGQPFSSLLPIFSLAFLSPFAMLLGQELIEIQKTKLNTQHSNFIFLESLKTQLKKIENIVHDIPKSHHFNDLNKEIDSMENLISVFEQKDLPSS